MARLPCTDHGARHARLRACAAPAAAGVPLLAVTAFACCFGRMIQCRRCCCRSVCSLLAACLLRVSTDRSARLRSAFQAAQISRFCSERTLAHNRGGKDTGAGCQHRYQSACCSRTALRAGAFVSAAAVRLMILSTG